RSRTYPAHRRSARFFFSSRRRHTRSKRDWSSDVCSSDLIAALSVGLGQGAYEAAKSYAKEREQFGKPISKFDAVRNKIVDMDRKLERARLLTQKAASTYDAGGDVGRLSALAKLDASEVSREIAEDAVQVLGG